MLPWFTAGAMHLQECFDAITMSVQHSVVVGVIDGASSAAATAAAVGRFRAATVPHGAPRSWDGGSTGAPVGQFFRRGLRPVSTAQQQCCAWRAAPFLKVCLDMAPAVIRMCMYWGIHMDLVQHWLREWMADLQVRSIPDLLATLLIHCCMPSCATIHLNGLQVLQTATAMGCCTMRLAACRTAVCQYWQSRLRDMPWTPQRTLIARCATDWQGGAMQSGTGALYFEAMVLVFAW